jgi:hypothetical protein
MYEILFVRQQIQYGCGAQFCGLLCSARHEAEPATQSIYFIRKLISSDELYIGQSRRE